MFTKLVYVHSETSLMHDGFIVSVLWTLTATLNCLIQTDTDSNSQLQDCAVRDRDETV